MNKELLELEDCKKVFERHLKELNFAYRFTTQRDDASLTYVDIMTDQINDTVNGIKNLERKIRRLKEKMAQ